MNKAHKTILGAIIVIAIAVGVNFWGTSNPSADANKLTNVKIAYLPIVQALPLYIGIEKGYFEEVGIQVEAVKLGNPNLIIDSLLSGQVDFGAPGTASGIAGIAETVKPGELKIFALIGGDNSTTNDVLIVKNDSGLETIADLTGKKLGILPGIQFRTIAKHILAENGLTDKDVEIIELAPPLQIQALAANQVHALLTVEPMGTIASTKDIGHELIHAPMVQFISEPWYGAVGVVRAKFDTENPEISQKVLDVFERTIAEINEDPDATRQYLKGYTALDDNLIAIAPFPIFKMHKDFTDNDIDALQKFFDIFTEHEVIEEKVSARGMIYSK